MGTDFKMTTEIPQARPDVTVLHLAGWLDAHSEQTLVDAVQKARDGGAKFILIDLREADTLTSAGIRALHKSFQIMNPKEQAHKVAHLKLCNAPAQVYQVLSITGILVNAPMYESMEDAIDSFEA